MTKFSETLTQLNMMQRKFVEEYLIEPTKPKQALIKAGYAESIAPSDLLNNPRVRSAIEAGMSEVADRVGVTQERIILELAKIAFANTGDILSVTDLKNLSRDQLAALSTEINIRELEGKQSKLKDIKIKSVDKLNALTLLGKHLGMFKEKVDVTGTLTLEQLVEASMKEKEDNS